MSKRHSEVFQRVLPCRLTDAERMKRGIEIGELQEELQKSEDEFKGLKSDFDRKKKRIVERIKELGEITRTGKEDRAVDCQRRYDHSSDSVTEVRLDTLEEILRRDMNPSERQMFFNFVVTDDMPPSDEETTDETTTENETPTPEAIEKAAAFNDEEWKFKEEVSDYKKNQLKKALDEFAQAEATPTNQMKLRVVRDEINRRAGMAPNEFGVYIGFEQTEVLVQEGDGWRVTIQTLKTPVGWIRSFSYYTAFEQTGGEALIASHVFETQAHAIMDAAFRIKVANRNNPEWTSDQKRCAQQITKYVAQLIESQEKRLMDANDVQEEEQ